MKITYQFADGTTSTSEVDEEIGAYIMESRRQEENANRRHRYHSYSLDAITYEGTEYGRNDKYPCEGPDEVEETAQRVRDAFSHLSAIQQKRLLMVAKGMSLHDIAAAEGSAYSSVKESVDAARKKFLKFF